MIKYKKASLRCDEYYIDKAENLRARNNKHRFDIKNFNSCLMALDKHISFCGNGRFTVAPFYKMKMEGIIAYFMTGVYFIRKYQPSSNKRIEFGKLKNDFNFELNSVFLLIRAG